MTYQLYKSEMEVISKRAAEVHYNFLKAPGWSSFEKHWASNPDIAMVWGVIVAGIISAAGQAAATREAAQRAADDANAPQLPLSAGMLIEQGERHAGAVREPFRGTEPHAGLKRAIPGALAALDPAQRADNVRALLAEFDTLTKVRDQVARDLHHGQARVYWIGAFWWATVARTGKVTRLAGDLNERDGYNEHGELEDGTKFRVTPLIISPGFFGAHFEGLNHEWVPYYPPCLEPGRPAREQFGQS